MEKLQTLLIILLGLGALVWRMVQKARDTAAQEARERPGTKGPPLPDTSFQELLKQMQTQNAASRPGEPTPAQAAGPPRTLQAASVPGRPAPADRRNETRRALPPARPQPVAPAGTAPRSLPDMLRNPADLRAAFVLSEILKRKFD